MKFCWDSFTGFYSEKNRNRTSETFSNWFSSWVAGSAVVFSLQLFGGALLALSASNFSRHHWAFLLTVDFLLLFLAWKLYNQHFQWIPALLKRKYSPSLQYQSELEQELLKRGFSIKENPHLLYFYQSHDCSILNGGSIGGGKYRRYMISSASLEHLSPTQLAILIWRDECLNHPSERSKCFFLSLIYCFIGLLLAQLTMISMGHFFWDRWFWLLAFLSSWFFLALFIFPFYSRKNYLRVDRRVMEAGVSLEEYRTLLIKIHHLNAADSQVPSWIESIFYPIPSLSNRLSNLAKFSI